ncbi:MAG TPA: phage minor tail protein L [Acidocella sp.]|nr:phage minor tail protein L [Acidocella sp.]
MTATTPASITAEIQRLAPDAVIDLFVLDLSTLTDAAGVAGPVLYYHGGTNDLYGSIVWQGVTYYAFPVQMTGLEYNGRGQLPKPKIQVSNTTGAMTALILQYGDLLGAKVTMKRTLAKFLDAVNFPGGVNANADPTAEFPDDIFFINQRTVENRSVVEFELAASFDFQGVQLPRRPIIQNVCTWIYRGPECTYAGTNYFDINDQPVTSAAADVCAKHLSSCKARFGQYSQLPYGSFPAAGLLRA